MKNQNQVNLRSISLGLALALFLFDDSSHASDLESANQKKSDVSELTQPEAPEVEKLKITIPRRYAGVLAGYGVVASGGSGGGYFVFAGRVGAELVEREENAFSLGLLVGARADEDVRLGSLRAKSRMVYFVAEALNRRSFGTGLIFGVRLGVGSSSVTIESPSLLLEGTGASFVWGPVVGYEVALADSGNMHLVFDVAWLNSTGSTIDFGASKLPYGSSSAILFQAGLNFGF